MFPSIELYQQRNYKAPFKNISSLSLTIYEDILSVLMQHKLGHFERINELN